MTSVLEQWGAAAADAFGYPLRKAKYVVRHRPRWLSLAALGARQDFAVVATGEHSLRLESAQVPLARVGRD